MGMLGVVVVESAQRHFVMDVWGSPQKPRKGIKGPIVVIGNTARNEQRHVWAYFQRTLSVTDNTDAVCADQLRAVLLGSEYNEFARQRNGLHYRTNAWCCDDLHACAVKQEFGRLPIGIGAIDPSQDDFSLILAFGLVRMGRAMLAELAESSGVLLGELSLIDTWLAQPFNALYQQNLQLVHTSTVTPAAGPPAAAGELPAS
jgi:hypothetical protein